MQAVSSGKVVNPYDRDQEQGWDHVDFVDRRAAVGGELGQPGAGRVVQVARARAGRRLPRRLQGPRRAERRRRHRPAGRVHAQEAAHPARDRRGGLARRARAGRARSGQGRAGGGHAAAVRLRRPGRARRDDDDGVLLYHVYGRQFPLDDRRLVVDRGSRRRPAAFGELGRLWVLGPTGWREWPPERARRRRARPARARRRHDPPAGACTPSTTATRWRTPAPPTSAGAAARCRARSRATSPPGARAWRPACSRPRPLSSAGAPAAARRPLPAAPCGAARPRSDLARPLAATPLSAAADSAPGHQRHLAPPAREGAGRRAQL